MKLVMAIVLVDVPVLAAAFVAGAFYGYADTYNTVMDYRMQHWWTFLPSLLLAIVVWRRWRKT